MSRATILNITVLGILMGALVAGTARADQNWDGEDGSWDFGNAVNWYGNSQPGWGYGGSLHFSYENGGGVYNNYGLWVNTDAIYWDSTYGGSYPVNGAGQGINFDSKIENNSSYAQTLNIPSSGAQNGATSIQLNPVSGDLTLSTNVYNDNNKFYNVYGDNGNTLHITGTLGGDSSVGMTLQENSTVVISNAQTIGGDFYINEGTLRLAVDNAIPAEYIRLQSLNGEASVNVDGGLTATNGITASSDNSTAKTLANTAGTSGTATYSGNMYLDTPVTLYANSGGTVALSGSTLDLKNQTLTVDGDGSSTISGTLTDSTGSGKLTKRGAGTLTLSSANSHNGTTVIGDNNTSTPGGTIEVQNGSALGTGSVNFNHGGTLELGVDGLTISNPLNWYNWGATTTRSVKLDLGGSNSGTMSGQITLRSGGSNQNVFEVGTNDTLTVSGKLHNWNDGTKSSLTKTGAGTLVLSSSDTATYQSGTIINGGTLQLGDGGANGALATHADSYISIASGATFSINQSDAVTQGTDFDADPITGDGNFVQAGSGTTTLNVMNTYSGSTTVDGGTLALMKPSGHQWYTSPEFNINNGSTLQLGRDPVNGLFFFTSKDWNFDSNGGGAIELVGNPGIFWSVDNTVTTAGGAENVITNASISTHDGVNAGTTTFDVADGTGDRDLTVSTAFTSEGEILKTGAGILALSGANTYTGDTIIDAGWLELGVGGTAGSLSTSSTITNDGVFAVYRSDTVTQGTDFSGDPITGSGHVMQLGTSGTLVLNAANTHSGGTKIGRQDPAWGGQTVPTQEGGTIEILNSDALGTGELQYQKGGTLELGTGGLSVGNLVSVPNWSGAPKVIRLDEDGSNTGTMSGNVWLQNTSVGSFDVDVGADDTLTMSGAFYDGGAGGVGVDKLGDGTLILTGDSENYSANNTVGDTRIYAGTLQLGDGGAAGTMATTEDISISAGATFAVNQSDTVTQGTDFSAQALSGDGGFSQAGSGTTVLNLANTYAGDTVISNGTLQLSGGSAIPDGSGKGNVIVASGGTLDLNGSSETINGLSGSGTIDNSAAGACVLTVCSNDASSTFDGTIQDTGGNLRIDKVGTGTLTLTGANSYQGGTKLGLVHGPTAGTVSIEDSAALGTGVFGFEAGGTLNFGVSGLSIPNSVHVYFRNDTAARTIKLDQDGTSVGELSGAIDLRWNGANGFVADVGTDDTLTLSGTIENYPNAGGSGVTKSGAGTLILSGANSYRGHTTISNGTLKLSGGSAIPDGSGKGDVTVASGATLDLNGSSETINGLSGSGTVDNTAGGGTYTLTVGNLNDTTTFSGDIKQSSGTVTLTKVGTGTLTLSGSGSTFSGTAALQGGKLIFTDSGALGNANLVYLYSNPSGGELDLEFGADGLDLSRPVQIQNSDGNKTIRLDLPGANTGTVSGNVDIRSSYSGQFDVDVGADDSLTFSGTMYFGAAGAAGVTKLGTGSLTVTGNNTYNGPTTIEAGTLLVNNTAGSGTSSGAVSVNDAATLGGTGSMSGLVTANSGGHIAPGTSIGTITMAGGLTLNDGSVLDYEVDTSGGTGDKIMVGGGTFTGAASADGVTVNVTLSGTPSSEATYTLINWSAATASGVELDDFDLVCNTVGEYRGTLQIVGSELQLSVATIPGSIFRFR